MDFKTYKVIEIVDDITLLIDYGFDNNAKRGDTLRIIEKGERVMIDGTDYGTLDPIKAIVEVITPYKQFSVCRKVMRGTVHLLDPLISARTTMLKMNPLNVDAEDMTNRAIPTSALPVKKGDTALLTNE